VELYLLVDEQPDATLEELGVLMAKRLKVRVSMSTATRYAGTTYASSRAAILEWYVPCGSSEGLT